MSTNPLPRQSERTKYPGMRPREGHVFRLWLREHEGEYDTFIYNARVGTGRDPGAAFSASVRTAAILSSQQRIDAVGWSGGVPTLIEVKDFATMTAIGQLLEYAALWAASYPLEKAARLLIVCSAHEPGFLDRAAAAGIRVDVLPPH